MKTATALLQVEKTNLLAMRKAIRDETDRIAGKLAQVTSEKLKSELRRHAQSLGSVILASLVDAQGRAVRRSTDAAKQAVDELQAELAAHFVPFAPSEFDVPYLEPSDDSDARTAAEALVLAWLLLSSKKADQGVAPAKIAQESTRDFMYRVDRTVTTETARAFSDTQESHAKQLAASTAGKPSGQLLFKRWDAILDRSTCAVCSNLDNQVVSLSEPFRGDLLPGYVHPNCRCISIPCLHQYDLNVAHEITREMFGPGVGRSTFGGAHNFKDVGFLPGHRLDLDNFHRGELTEDETKEWVRRYRKAMHDKGFERRLTREEVRRHETSTRLGREVPSPSAPRLRPKNEMAKDTRTPRSIAESALGRRIGKRSGHFEYGKIVPGHR